MRPDVSRADIDAELTRASGRRRLGSDRHERGASALPRRTGTRV